MNNKFDFKTISSSQASTMGDLQRLLSQGEYPPFTSAPIFESKFVQVKSHLNQIIWHVQDKIACNYYLFFKNFLSSTGIPHSFSLFLFSDYHTHIGIFPFAYRLFLLTLYTQQSRNQTTPMLQIREDKKWCFHPCQAQLLSVATSRNVPANFWFCAISLRFSATNVSST